MIALIARQSYASSVTRWDICRASAPQQMSLLALVVGKLATHSSAVLKFGATWSRKKDSGDASSVMARVISNAEMKKRVSSWS